jgi:mono/diheme cytochrome c family protein
LGGQRAGGAMTGSHLAHGGWYAPSLIDPAEAGVGHWTLDEVVQWLRSGVTAQGTAQGPMAEVVVRSTQHLPEPDLRAMAVYLRSLSPAAPPANVTSNVGYQAAASDDAARQQTGEKLYVDHCASCHGKQGQGAPGIYPALAGSRLVTMDDPGNLLRVITQGGFAPATAANPRPYGMPPFDLGHTELAALTTYLRSAWGHRAAPVSEVQVLTTR